jgi:molybdopterin-containing oxidoreductase family iron-sulfur binding subunit
MDTDNLSRKHFLKLGAVATTTLAALNSMPFVLESKGSETLCGETVKLLTSDGRLVQVDKKSLKLASVSRSEETDALKIRARKGIEGRKWVMVIDLARCKHAMACQKSCNKNHHVPSDRQWLNIYEMQDAKDTAPYWMPKTCFHCDNPPCVKVCPVDATYIREDGIVLIDNDRCIGCRFCMAACPYSARVFNWREPDNTGIEDQPYDPEKGFPRKMGTVEKCDFCPDMLREEKLPHCVTACPNGVYFMGDMNEDTVTNGSETFRFSQLMKDRAGYRYLEELGTGPSVYYLPPVNRQVPFDETDKHLGDNKNGMHHS